MQMLVTIAVSIYKLKDDSNRVEADGPVDDDVYCCVNRIGCESEEGAGRCRAGAGAIGPLVLR